MCFLKKPNAIYKTSASAMICYLYLVTSGGQSITPTKNRQMKTAITSKIYILPSPTYLPHLQVQLLWASSLSVQQDGWSAPSYRDTPPTDCTPSQQSPLSDSSSETSLYSCRKEHTVVMNTPRLSNRSLQSLQDTLNPTSIKVWHSDQKEISWLWELPFHF